MFIYWPQWDSNSANDALNYDGKLRQLWMDCGVTATSFNIQKFQVGMTRQRQTSLDRCQYIRPVGWVFSDISVHNWCILESYISDFYSFPVTATHCFLESTVTSHTSSWFLNKATSRVTGCINPDCCWAHTLSNSAKSGSNGSPVNNNHIY